MLIRIFTKSVKNLAVFGMNCQVISARRRVEIMVTVRVCVRGVVAVPVLDGIHQRPPTRVTLIENFAMMDARRKAY